MWKAWGVSLTLDLESLGCLLDAMPIDVHAFIVCYYIRVLLDVLALM